MIVQNYTEGFDGKLIHTKSDAGFYIRNKETGVVYAEADDPTDAGREYEETTEKIEVETPEENQPAEA